MSNHTHIPPNRPQDRSGTPHDRDRDLDNAGPASRKPSIKLRFKEAYDLHADALFRYAFYKLSDREKAKDVVQDTFVKVWEYLVSSMESEGVEIANIKALLYRIATNAIIDNYRKKKELSLDSMMDDGYDPDDVRNSGNSIIDESEAELVIRSIHALEDEDRAVILMRYIDGLTVKEIASITGQRENTVSVRIHRALKTLKDVLQIDVERHQSQ
jgi:RNA polymerase sigma-70 factor (ECF subfamily)